jgi:hypothetical protein
MASLQQTDLEGELLQQGFAALERRDLPSAENAFNRAFEGHRSREALYGLGLIALTRGERQLAQRRFTELVNADPKHANACFYLGEVSRLEGNLDEARRWFEQAKSIHPNHQGANARLHQLSPAGVNPNGTTPNSGTGGIARSSTNLSSAAVPADAAKTVTSYRGIYDIVAADPSPVAAGLKRALDELEMERTPSKISWLCHPGYRLTVPEVRKDGTEPPRPRQVRATPGIVRALPWLFLVADLLFCALWLLSACTDRDRVGLKPFLTALDGALPTTVKAAAILIPLLYFGVRIGWVCLQASMCRFVLKNGQINVIYGIIRKGQITEELYQVRDLYFERNRLDRLFDQGTLALLCDRPGGRTETIKLTGFYPGCQLPEIVQKYRNICQKLRAGANYYNRGLVQ